MTTSAARPSDQAISHTNLYYDPDDALPKGSPLMNTVTPIFSLAPGPQLTTPRRVDNTRPDAALIANLDSFRGTALAQDIMSKRRGEGPLEPVPVADNQSPCSSPAHSPPPRPSEPQFPQLNRRGAPVPASLDLKILAADALAFTSQSGAQMPTVAHIGSPQGGADKIGARTALDLGPSALAIRGNDSRAFGQEERTSVLAAPAAVHSSGKDHYHGRPPANLTRPTDQASPTSPQQPSSGGLPPLQIDSPRSDSSAHGQALPSIRQHFSDLQLSPDNELPGLRHTGSFSRSPPSSLPNISSMANFAAHHATSPTSPNNGFRPPDLPSPQALSAPGYGFHTFGNVAPSRLPGGDHSSGTADTPSSDQSSTAPAADRLDGLTISSQQGGYICTFSGCTAAPFQTQYLLNSHANVHSSARPHYCPVIGCSRSEGGKGFKRKNEMIRHGLVHESPGYVCPFCPDREHKYPRPDNLQRHVRVHHMDKDKDDPALRDVLSQRPDGPNRGRRRRGAAS